MLGLIKTFVALSVLITAGYAIFYTGIAREWRKILGYRPVLIGLAIMAFGLFVPSLWVIYFLFFLIPILFSRRREQIAPIYVIALLVSPELYEPLIIGGIPFFPYSVQLSLALGALVALTISPGQRNVAPLSTFAPLMLLMGLLLLANAHDVSITAWLKVLIELTLKYGVPCYVLRQTLGDIKGLRALAVAMSCAGAILGMIALFEVVRSWPLFEIMYQRLGISRFGAVVKMRHGLIRPYGPMFEPTDLGFVLALCLAAVLAARKEFTKYAHFLLVLGLVVGGLLSTQSRGGLVGALVVFVAVPLYRRGVRGIMEYLLLVPLGAVAYAGMTFIGPDVGRLADPTIQGPVDYRAALLSRGLEEYWKHPWLGTSFGHVVGAMSDLLQGEGIVDFVNSYLYFALIGGIVGLALFVTLFLWPSVRLLLIRKRLPPGSLERDMGAFCAASIAAAAAMFAFTSFLPRGSVVFLLVAVAAFSLDPVRQARRLAAMSRARGAVLKPPAAATGGSMRGPALGPAARGATRVAD